MIADALEICRQSVKEYLMRIRRALDEACMSAGLTWTGRDILWTRRVQGGFIHGLQANVEIRDDPEFGYRDILDNPMRIEGTSEVTDV